MGSGVIRFALEVFELKFRFSLCSTAGKFTVAQCSTPFQILKSMVEQEGRL